MRHFPSFTFSVDSQANLNMEREFFLLVLFYICISVVSVNSKGYLNLQSRINFFLSHWINFFSTRCWLGVVKNYNSRNLFDNKILLFQYWTWIYYGRPCFYLMHYLLRMRPRKMINGMVSSQPEGGIPQWFCCVFINPLKIILFFSTASSSANSPLENFILRIATRLSPTIGRMAWWTCATVILPLYQVSSSLEMEWMDADFIIVWIFFFVSISWLEKSIVRLFCWLLLWTRVFFIFSQQLNFTLWIFAHIPMCPGVFIYLFDPAVK